MLHRLAVSGDGVESKSRIQSTPTPPVLCVGRSESPFALHFFIAMLAFAGIVTQAVLTGNTFPYLY